MRSTVVYRLLKCLWLYRRGRCEPPCFHRGARVEEETSFDCCAAGAVAIYRSSEPAFELDANSNSVPRESSEFRRTCSSGRALCVFFVLQPTTSLLKKPDRWPSRPRWERSRGQNKRGQAGCWWQLLKGKPMFDFACSFPDCKHVRSTQLPP